MPLSPVVVDYVVDARDHALREVSLGDEAAYRIADFPLTAEVLRPESSSRRQRGGSRS